MCFYHCVNLQFCSTLYLGLRNTCLAFKDSPVHGDNENSSKLQYSQREKLRKIAERYKIEREVSKYV